MGRNHFFQFKSAGAAAISVAIGFWNAKKQGLSNGETAKDAVKAGANSSAPAMG